MLDTKIPYLDAFVEEAVRVPAVAGIITRRATVDTEVLGHHVSAGANSGFNTCFAHPRAQTRVPDAKSLPTLVFGRGLRGCFGMDPSSSTLKL